MRLLLFLAFTAFLGSCAHQPEQVFRFQKPLMHTRWDFSIVALSQDQAKTAFEAASAEIERLDKMLAMWRPDSELYAFNAKAGQGPQKVSTDLDTVITLGQDISEKSGGAADSTVGPLVQLWYENLKKRQLPKPADIAAALRHVDYHLLKRTGERTWSVPEGTRVDLGSVAKGYASDASAAALRAYGIKNFLINAGGQVYAQGHKPDGSKWSVGVINPRNPEKIVTILKLEDQSMSTSGDYEQSTFINGKRYHHIMDPKTGWPVTNHVSSVTVILPLSYPGKPGAGSWCDAMDTPALVLGMEKGRKLLQDNQASGILIHEGRGGRLDAAVTDDLKGKITLILN